MFFFYVASHLQQSKCFSIYSSVILRRPPSFGYASNLFKPILGECVTHFAVSYLRNVGWRKFKKKSDVVEHTKTDLEWRKH